MQSNFKAARKIVGMALFTSFLCIFIQFSFHFMLQQFSTEVVGYDVHEVLEDESFVDHGYIPKSELPENPDPNMTYVPVLSEMPASVKVVEKVISTICSLGVLFCTAGSVLANVAAKDRNDCDLNGAEHDKKKGFIIGLMAAVPAFVCYIATIVLRFFPSNSYINWYFWFYRFIIMGPVKPINDAITTAEVNLAAIPWWFVAVQGVYLVLFVVFCYLMYYICYNEDSVLAKLLYKSTQKQQNFRRLGSR